MSSAIIVVVLGLGLLFLYGIGVFAMCLHAGESLRTAMQEASSWWAAYAISYFFTYLVVTLR